MAFLAFVPVALKLGGELFNATNPNDAARLEEVKRLTDLSLGGDLTAFVKLTCLSGDNTVRAQAVELGLLTAEELQRGTNCGYATGVGRSAAKAALIYIRARREVAVIAGRISLGAAKVANTAVPGTVGTPVSTTTLAVGGGALIVVGVVLALLFFRESS